jgi:protein-S-isoprenylcysteine O-methyltransferase Ste14
MQIEIVKSGPYKYIRHPCYISSIMVIAGLSLLYIPLAITYLAFAFFLARAINEEQILSINPEYKDYQKKTGMFLPRIKWFNKDYQ